MSTQHQAVPAVEVHYPNGERRIALGCEQGSRGKGSTTQDVRGYTTNDGSGFIVTERAGELKRH